MKKNSDGRRPQNKRREKSLQPRVRSYSNYKPMLQGPFRSLQSLWTKTTSNGKRPQNIKFEICQQPMKGCYLNLEPKLMGKNETCRGFKWRRHQNV